MSNNVKRRAGYVAPWVKRLPQSVRALWCRWGDHPAGALKPFTWLVEDERVPGYKCLRCFGRVFLPSIATDGIMRSIAASGGEDDKWICSGGRTVNPAPDDRTEP